jgi:hypothetical protein
MAEPESKRTVVHVGWKIAVGVLSLLLAATLSCALCSGLHVLELQPLVEEMETVGEQNYSESRFFQENADHLASEVVADVIQTDSAALNNAVCLMGIITLRGWFVDEVQDACDRAVELEPENGIFHDSRGLARLLSWDYRGAIEDFTSYLSWLRDNGLYEQFGPEREMWIEALEQGDCLMSSCDDQDGRSFCTFTNPEVTIDLSCIR